MANSSYAGGKILAVNIYASVSSSLPMTHSNTWRYHIRLRQSIQTLYYRLNGSKIVRGDLHTVCDKPMCDLRYGRFHVQVGGVTEVHDLHVWALKPGVTLLAVHLNLAPGADGSVVLQQSTGYCRSLGIDHSTIQIIKDGEECCGQTVARLGDNDQHRYCFICCTCPSSAL